VKLYLYIPFENKSINIYVEQGMVERPF